MKRRWIALLVTIAAAALSTTTAGAASGPSASGGGHFYLSDSPDSDTTFAFNAVSGADGAVSGQARFEYQGIRVRMDVNCLFIRGDRDIAVVSGPIVSHSGDPAAEGLTGLFTAQDAGKGSADPDRISAPEAHKPDSGVSCTSAFPPGPDRDVTQGSIQVNA